jgi:probable HAF family extracellular repeat protein
VERIDLGVRIFAVLTLFVGCVSSISAEIRYEVTDLGSLGPRLADSIVTSVNNSGQVTGYFDTAGGYFPPTHAFLYSNGQMRDLDTPGRRGTSAGYGINDAGEVTGSWENWDGQPFAEGFVYSKGQILTLGTLGGTRSIGHGINNLGQVTGTSLTEGNSADHAFLYSDGQLRDLGVVPGFSSSEGYGINDLGQVTGILSDTTPLSRTPIHAFLYSSDQMTDLGTLGGDTSQGNQ